MPLPVGILGGAFDPVHNGHLHFAVACLRRLNFAELRLIPFHVPPHRPPSATPVAARLDMLRLATASDPGLVVDDCEARRGGVSYTIDTLRALREQTDAPLCLLMGADNLGALHRWRKWKSLLHYAHILVAQRPGASASLADSVAGKWLAQHVTQTNEALRRQRAGYVMQLDFEMLAVSSTQVRDNFSRRLDNAALLPEAVLAYIHEHHLYGT